MSKKIVSVRDARQRLIESIQQSDEDLIAQLMEQFFGDVVKAEVDPNDSNLLVIEYE